MLNTQIKRYRLQAGLSQQKVAALLNMSQQALAYYEAGSREPNVDTLKKLCVIFDCTLDELLEFDTPQRREAVKSQLNKM